MELPGAEPAVLTGTKIGYTRVPADPAEADRVLDALTGAGCSRIFTERDSGKDGERPELAAALEFLRPGDVLVVPALDRVGRSLPDLIGTVIELRRRGVGFASLQENLDTTTPGGGLVFDVFTALAEFARELVISEAHERVAAARGRGPVRRALVATPELIQVARDLLPDPAHSVASIARLLGVSPATLYHHIPDLRELRPGSSPAATRERTADPGGPPN
jgi:DNA invertase Pin-like site-specific DNA recombinase